MSRAPGLTGAMELDSEAQAYTQRAALYPVARA